MLLRLLSRRRFRLPKVSDLQSRRSLTGQLETFGSDAKISRKQPHAGEA